MLVLSMMGIVPSETKGEIIMKEELAEAAAEGIRRMLSTTRGAHLFGAGATVEVHGTMIYITTKGQTLAVKVV